MPEDSAREYALDCIIRTGDGLWPGPTPPDSTRVAAMVHEHAARLRAWESRGANVFCHHTPHASGLLLVTATRAWLYGLSASAEDSMDEAIRRWLSRTGDAPWSVGGPAGGYLVSGWPEPHATASVFVRHGFTRRSTHVDLHVELLRAPAPDPRVRRAEPGETEALLEWVRVTFADAWKQEVADALPHVFVAGAPGRYLGFVAHSGHNRAVGTFGPLGVDVDARAGGLGSALTRAALDDMAARGNTHVVIPWVDPAREAFYARCVAGVTAHNRARWSRNSTQAP